MSLISLCSLIPAKNYSIVTSKKCKLAPFNLAHPIIHKVKWRTVHRSSVMLVHPTHGLNLSAIFYTIWLGCEENSNTMKTFATVFPPRGVLCIKWAWKIAILDLYLANDTRYGYI